MNNTAPLFFNRDLSWIDFNERVLEEGLRKDLPPLSRLKFLSIVSSNFDEFFMVRVAAIKRALRTGKGKDPSGIPLEKQLSLVSEKVRAITKRQYDCLLHEVFPALAKGGLEMVRPGAYTAEQEAYLENLFVQEIFPVLTPLRIESGKELPAVGNLRLYAAFLLEADHAGNGESPESYVAIVQIPAILDRIVWLPSADGEKKCWTLLDDVIISRAGRLFSGYVLRENMLFRLTRDADFSVDEERDEDFVEAMEAVLIGREYSRPVRMTFTEAGPRLLGELGRRFGLAEEDLYEMGGPLDLRTLAYLAAVRGFDPLKTAPWKSYWTDEFPEDEPLWGRIRAGDVLLHLPYHSFDPVVRFFQDAADDPQVISIKTALYRTSGDSPVIKALERAAMKGKQVTAVVELKARFDEERNISWANRLERAGVIVVYGLAKLKVHAKATLVVRRESDGIMRYVHLSTGNYNDKTARQYEDICLFTAQEDIASDTGLLFNMITGYSVIQGTRKLVMAPKSLKRTLLGLIERETARSSQEYPGKIMAKMNSLADTDVIEALYRASHAGVKILLNVRGICMLVPGLPGLSENIRVVSIVDHYLEHSRIFYFSNGGAEDLFLSSADWMPRNLERRVELMFPVQQEDIRRQVLDILETYFRDNCQAWVLESSGIWKSLEAAPGEERLRAQEYFLKQVKKHSESGAVSKQEFIVRRSLPGEGTGMGRL